MLDRVAVAGSGGLGKARQSERLIPPSLQATSAGTISVAIWPGAVRAATIASAASRPTSDEERRRPQPFGIRPRDGFDVGSQRRIVAQMIGGMLADEVDDRHLGPAGIVQIRETIAEAGAEMKSVHAGFSAMRA